MRAADLDLRELHRLREIELHIAPLSERKEDILPCSSEAGGRIRANGHDPQEVALSRYRTGALPTQGAF
jgi:DNA-binding NtrC family response regulator